MSTKTAPIGLLIAIAAVLGFVLGAGGFTFIYAKGFSYLNDKPETCINCHVMYEHYDGWLNASHASVAVCADCHIAQQNIIAKYWSKGVAGLNHSVAFTTGNYPEHIRISEGGREIAEANCRNCHANIVHAIDQGSADGEPLSCIRCHAAVGHGP